VRRAGGALAALVALALPLAAGAHPLTPALLSLQEREPGLYDVVWRVPVELAAGGRRPMPVWPAGAQREGAGERTRMGDADLERFRMRIPGGLTGRSLDVRAGDPHDPASADAVRGGEVLVRIAALDGRSITGRIVPGRSTFTVPGSPGWLAVAGTYLRLGVEHILTGIDHLLFVLALTLLASSLTALVKTITAFTVAHSLTLALASLGVVQVPSAPVEAVIALSIVFVARELWLLANRRPGLGARRPWPVALGFGLLHGLGFAGALGEIGLPPTDIPLALFTFNLGVELGQLLFIAVVLGAVRLLTTLQARLQSHLPGKRPLPGKLLASYAVGVLATFWVFERVSAFW
jgi:hydrogenase/urease accessory protein HupE